MAYESVMVKVYNQLANETGIEPSVELYILPSQILQFDIEPDIFTADDAFSIRKTATIKTVWEGQFQHWIQTKAVCALYPEYYDAVIGNNRFLSLA